MSSVEVESTAAHGFAEEDDANAGRSVVVNSGRGRCPRR